MKWKVKKLCIPKKGWTLAWSMSPLYFAGFALSALTGMNIPGRHVFVSGFGFLPWGSPFCRPAQNLVLLARRGQSLRVSKAASLPRVHHGDYLYKCVWTFCGEERICVCLEWRTCWSISWPNLLKSFPSMRTQRHIHEWFVSFHCAFWGKEYARWSEAAAIALGFFMWTSGASAWLDGIRQAFFLFVPQEHIFSVSKQVWMNNFPTVFYSDGCEGAGSCHILIRAQKNSEKGVQASASSDPTVAPQFRAVSPLPVAFASHCVLQPDQWRIWKLTSWNEHFGQCVISSL